MTNSTAWSQCINHKYSFSDGCKIYTKDQRKNCLNCFIDLEAAQKNILAKDSIILVQANDLIKKTQDIKKIDSIAKKSEKRAGKYKKQRNTVTIVGTFLAIGTFLVGLFV